MVEDVRQTGDIFRLVRRGGKDGMQKNLFPRLFLHLHAVLMYV
jgi:hypothetical protein